MIFFLIKDYHRIPQSLSGPFFKVHRVSQSYARIKNIQHVNALDYSLPID